nr:hypothetical protein [Actinomadura mexicana]
MAVRSQLQVPGAAYDLAVVLHLKHGKRAGLAVSDRAKPEEAFAGHQALAAVDRTVGRCARAVDIGDGISLTTGIAVTEPGDMTRGSGSHQFKAVAVAVCLPDVNRVGLPRHKVRVGKYDEKITGTHGDRDAVTMFNKMLVICGPGGQTGGVQQSIFDRSDGDGRRASEEFAIRGHPKRGQFDVGGRFDSSGVGGSRAELHVEG